MFVTTKQRFQSKCFQIGDYNNIGMDYNAIKQVIFEKTMQIPEAVRVLASSNQLYKKTPWPGFEPGSEP